MPVFAEVAQRGHEQVAYFNFPDVGLKAIVGIHSTVLGPALGGCRMRVYADEERALDDVLRLSEGMTYKNAMAGLALGGGKSCILVDPSITIDRPALFRKFGECLNALAGRYIAAEDMGTSVPDVQHMRQVSSFVAGFAKDDGGGGDPSPFTALGVFESIRAAVERRFGSARLEGKHVTVQGVGHVGRYLIHHLHNAGAKVTVSDTNEELIRSAKNDFGVDAVGTDQIYDVACDVYAPCAVGQTVNADTVTRLRCAIIAGAANNQISNPSVYPALIGRSILYCPDFVINAGGVISCGAEYVPGGWKESWVMEKVNAIPRTLRSVLDESEKRGRFPEVVAVELAKERIDAVRQKPDRQKG